MLKISGRVNMKRQVPKLMRSSMLNILYIVTKYEDMGDGNFIAKEKFEVSEEELKKLKIKMI